MNILQIDNPCRHGHFLDSSKGRLVAAIFRRYACFIEATTICGLPVAGTARPVRVRPSDHSASPSMTPSQQRDERTDEGPPPRQAKDTPERRSGAAAVEALCREGRGRERRPTDRLRSDTAQRGEDHFGLGIGGRPGNRHRARWNS